MQSSTGNSSQHNTCCICLNNRNTSTSIYEQLPDTRKQIADIILQCLSIKINKHLQSQLEICKDCLQKLNNCYIFFTKCHQAKAIRNNVQETDKDSFQFELSDLDGAVTSHCKQESNVKASSKLLANHADDSANSTKIDLQQTNIKKGHKKCLYCKKLFSIKYYNTHMKRNKSNINITDDNKLKENGVPTIGITKKRKCQYCSKSLSCKYYYQHIRKHAGAVNKLRKWIRRQPLHSHLDKKQRNVSSDKESRTNLKKHSITCMHCGKCFSSKYFYTHVKKHDATSRVTNQVKGKIKKLKVKNRTKQAESIKLDVAVRKKVDSAENRVNLCPICGLSFKNKTSYLAHYRRHIGKLPYGCEECDKRFPTSNTLKNHSLSHTEKKHVCSYCGNRFSRISSYNRHIKYHTNDRRFICDICGKRYIAKADLESHRRRHTGHKPHQCDICSRTFFSGSALRYHKLVHGNQTFLCNVCGKAYTRPGSLKYHVKTHEKSDISSQSKQIKEETTKLCL